MRYLEKNQDKHEHKEWSDDLKELPLVTFPNVFSNLVCSVRAYTSDQFKNDKSLESHLQFTNGWVENLQIFRVNE